MKQFLITMLLTLVAVTSAAQSHRADTLNERVFDAKVREMVYRLNITDEQKPKFVSIYRRYSEEMIAAWGEHQRPSRPTTTEAAAALQKRRLERQQRAQAIRMKYIDEFAKVLNASQLNQFFDVENAIQKKLKARRDHANGRQNNHKRRAPRQ